jgi:hypothetical protein
VARTEGRIKCAIWRDPEFRQLSGAAQRAYLLVLSQPGMNYCGVIAYRPKPWAMLSSNTTPASVEKAFKELDVARYVVIDRDTEELWVRTFVNHDGVLDQPKLIMAMAYDFSTIESEGIRQGLAQGLPQGFLQGLAERFPKAYAQGFFHGLPEPFVGALACGRSPASSLDSPASTKEPAKPAPEQVILREFYDQATPKPAQPWPAMLGVVRKMLAAGWTADDVAWALRNSPAISTAALTFALNQRRGVGSGARESVGDHNLRMFTARQEARRNGDGRELGA